jgi:HEAT repeat protein
MNPFSAIARIWSRFTGRGTFDGAACIRLLNDPALSAVERDAAAESLALHPTPDAVQALFKVAVTPTEDWPLRETAAHSLGAIWSETGLDENLLSRLPERLRHEVVASMPPDRASGAKRHFS